MPIEDTSPLRGITSIKYVKPIQRGILGKPTDAPEGVWVMRESTVLADKLA